MEQWNLTIQRQIGAAWLLKASYLGNDLTHLWMIKETNPGVYITPDASGGCTFNVIKAGPCTHTLNPATRPEIRTSGAYSRS